MRTALVLSSGIVLMCAAVQSASAQNLVSNPGFETGDFTSWNQFDNTGSTGVSDSPVHSGNYAAYFGSVGSTGGIFQTLTTTPGTSYTFSFWLIDESGGNEEEGSSSFEASWDGTTVTSLTSLSDDFTKFSFSRAASGSSTDLRFAFRNDETYWDLDDVSVTAAAVGTVPEPASMSLMAMGLVGLAGFRRRRRTATR